MRLSKEKLFAARRETIAEFERWRDRLVKIERLIHDRAWDPPGKLVYVLYCSNDGKTEHLYRMTIKELSKIGPSGGTYFPVSARRAHNYIKQGVPHSTPLWLDDDGRIRKAEAGT